jgi:hypothetical protein
MEELQGVTTLAVFQHLMNLCCGLQGSLDDFQKPNENEDKQLLNAF